MNYDLTAGAVDSNGEQKAEGSFEYETDINMYKDVFAEDYCRNLKTDLEAQVAFIGKLEE